MAVSIYSYDGHVFGSNDQHGGLPWEDARGQWTMRPRIQPRIGADSVLMGAEISERVISVVFSYTGTSDSLELAFDKIMAALDPTNPTPRELVGLRYDGTQVKVDAIPTFPFGLELDGSVNGLRCNFVTMDVAWRKVDQSVAPGPTSADVFTLNSSPETVTITVNGQARTAPLIALCLASGGQRTTDTASVGWKYRKVQPITNTTTADWYRELQVFDLGDTEALVAASKARSNGADLRVRLEGTEFPRTLMGWNTKRTFCAVSLTLPAGETVDLEILYGNPSASASDALTLSGYTRFDGSYCAADLSSDSGTSTGANSSSTFNDTGKAWPVNFWAGGFIHVLGTGTGGGQRRRIASNTATQIVPERNWGTTPTGQPYLVWKSGYMVTGGVASAAGATSLTDSAQSGLWGTDEWKGATLTNVTKGTTTTVTANTSAGVLTTTTASPAHATSDVYYLERYGVHNYYVRQTANDGWNHRGLWQINRLHSKPSKTDPNGIRGVASFRRTTYLPNGDDYSQYTVVDFGAIGSHSHWYMGTLYAQRRRSSDRTYSDEGQGDGVTIADPRRYTGARFDYAMLNENSASGASIGIGKFVFATRETGAGDWENVVEDTTRRTSLTASGSVVYRDLRNSDGNPQHLYFGMIPADEVAIAKDASVNDDARAELNARLELFIDSDSVTIGALGSEQVIYDLNGALSTDYIGVISQIGGDTLQFGGPGHHIHLRTSEVLWVDCETGSVYITSGGPISLSGGFTFDRYVPWAMVAGEYRDDPDNDGRPDRKVSGAWMPLEPGSNTWDYTEDAIGTLEMVVFWDDRWLG